MHIKGEVIARTEESQMNTSHLHALNLRLSHERGYLAAAKTSGEKELRAVWIAQIEKEIAKEREFLGLPNEIVTLSDDELFNELMG